MTEHEKLKEICDVIGYESKYWNTDVRPNWFYKWDCCWPEYIDVREIIFTQEFIDKYFNKLYWWRIRNWIEAMIIKEDILKNLDNPTEYLYNTLWLWT